MIVTFSVSNFRSFSSEETFSLIASNRLGSHNGHIAPIPGSKEGVLRTAILYGANGAGKSNLFKALQYFQVLAMETRKKNAGTGRETFRFNSLGDGASTFDLQFVAGDKLYRFGLKVDDRRIIEEWLIHVDGTREKPLYERTSDADGRVVIELQGLKAAGNEKLRALETIGGPQNQSFLATIYATLDSADLGEDLRSIFRWFSQGLRLIEPDASFQRLGHLLTEDEGFSQFASSFLKSASTGVDRLISRKQEVSEAELRSSLGNSFVSKIIEGLKEEDDGSKFFRISEGNELLVEHNGGNRFYQITIQAVHDPGSEREALLDLTEESDGTRRLLNLIPALYQLRRRGGVYFIDEIDRSLHPILVKQFLDFFLSSCAGDRRQIIVTTHESNLLDLNLLRRDEIWFAEKDPSSATRLYSMVDFKVRNDMEVRKHYLQGRFGAVPFLGELDRLLEASNRSE